MNANPLRALQALGQRLWLACPAPGLLRIDDLRALIEQDGVSGAASVPAAVLSRPDTVAAVRRIADQLLPVYEEAAGHDGYVSVAVSPHRAYDARGMVAASHEIMRLLERPNLVVEVPSTRAGLVALRHLIGEGVAVHASLIFSLSRYVEAAEAYLAGLEQCLAREKNLARIAAIVSFGVCSIDEAVDVALEACARREPAQTEDIADLRGRAAIACAQLAYETYRGIFTSHRFLALAARGARPQLLAWDCTGGDGSLLDEARYVDALIGSETLVILSREVLHHYREQGRPAARLDREIAGARRVFRRLSAAGVNLERVAWQLEARAVQQRIRCHDRLRSAHANDGPAAR